MAASFSYIHGGGDLLHSRRETFPIHGFQTSNTCNFFSWADKKELSDIDTTASEASQSSVASDILHEEWRRKNMKLKKKLKKKLAAQRRISNWLVVAIVMSWAVTFLSIMYCVSARGMCG